MAHAGKTKENSPNFAHGGIYEDGPYKVEIVNVDHSSESSTCCAKGRVAAAVTSTNFPPKPLIVAIPKDEGDYPVVQFHHGFTLQNMFYSQLIAHVASYGFIVVAPQVSGSYAIPCILISLLPLDCKV